MDVINYLMVDQNRKQALYRTGFRERVRIERFWWHIGVAELHLVPAGWVGGRRLAAYVDKLADSRGSLWIAPELEKYFPGIAPYCPEPELAAFLLKEQPFREILVLVPGEDKERRVQKEWWRQRFLELCFEGLNGLYVVSGQVSEQENDFFDWLYEQSGLPVCVTEEFPQTKGNKTVVVDTSPGCRLPVRKLARSCLYLDLTSDPQKHRILKQKRADISYVSARNYLDTAFKARYNAF